MFGTVFRYELRYHLTRPVTWLYFAIFAVGAFALVTTDAVALVGGSGQVKRNAPWVVVRAMLFMVLIGQVVVAGLVGNSVLRDYQYRTHELLFTTPITRFAYLGGRFFGAVAVMIVVHFGMVVGLLLGAVMPWLDPAWMLPVQVQHYLAPFLVLVVPAILVISAIFFAVGALTRSSFAVHTQGIVLLVAWIISQTLIGAIDDRSVAAMLDPIGLSAVDLLTRYWTVAEKNGQPVSLGGLLLANRIAWSAAALGLAALTFSVFRFRSAPPSLGFRRRAEVAEAPVPPPAVVRAVTQRFDGRSWWVQLLSSARMSFLSIVRQVPFAVIVTVGLINLGVAAAFSDMVFGQKVWPVTYTVVEVLEGQFFIFFVVLIALYAGEVVWRERELGADQIVDALPARTSATMLGKIGGLVLVEAVLLLMLLVAGIVFQASKGYFRFELPLYFSYLYGTVLPSLIQLTLLAVLIHVVVNQKYLGHALVILAFVLRTMAPSLGIEHPLLQYARTAPFKYSAMNGFGPFVPGLLWTALYWSGVAALLGVIAYLTWVRGTETSWPARRRTGAGRWRGSVRIAAGLSFLAVLGAGGVLFRNASVFNHYRSSGELRRLRADGERAYKPLARLPQPRLIDADVRVDLEPERLGFGLQGTFTYVNNHGVPIDSLFVTLTQRDLRIDTLTWARPATALVEDSLHGVRLYRLATPLAPNDTIVLRYRASFETRGFPISGPDTAAGQIPIRNAIAANGSFLNFQYFPILGYQSALELASDNDRRKEGLPPKVRAASIDDEAARAVTYLGINADWIGFRATVSTAPDQIAIAPGRLVREYQEGGRRVFEYRADEPMLAFYSFLSARYEVKRDRWNDVALEIYYHKGHEFNIDQMMEATKAALAEFSTRFSPYQFKQFRIVEFPRYSQFAQAFPGTIPFSESIGFILRAGSKEEDVDTPYYVTAHEMAHQWWFHQVVGGNVQGATVLSEALANYSAILLMERTLGRDNVGKFLKSQLDGYLTGRSQEAKAERPLMLVENQPYIHYNKGSVALYALRDLIGDEAMTRALARFVADKAFQKPPFTTSRELLGYLEVETPDSVRYALDDLFRTITLWDNAVERGVVSRRSDGKYDVVIDLRAAKFRADSLGNESPIPMADLVDIGVFGEKDPGAALGKPLYLAKHRIGSGTSTLRVVVDGAPRKVGIDPYSKLIDRSPNDNVIDVD